jgi:uncharacterized protein (DUF1800 family)
MPQPPLPPLSQLDPVEAWKPWQPDDRNPWNLKWAGHLYRRAAFGASWSELQAAVRDGPEETLQKLLHGTPGLAEFDQLMDSLAPSVQNFNQPNDPNNDLQGWWLYRMIYTLHPLQERMTLFWHNHFATSIAKVRQPLLMRNQNALLRKHALGKFRPFVLEMSKDPAMLIWLDSNSNVKGKPNENYARELMELFTLGVGHYTEKDIREAARAFTGWHVTQPTFNNLGRQVGQEYYFDRFAHDDGVKTFLTQTGKWDGGDIVRIVLDRKDAALFIVRKLYRHFISEGEAPPDRSLEPLANAFRQSDYDIAALMRTMLGSRHFFSEYAYCQRIKGPVEYVVGMLRSLGFINDNQRGEGLKTLIALPMDGLGQTLFAPPNVKGWDGGKAWLNSATLLARHNTAWRFLLGAEGPYGAKVNLSALVHKYADKKNYAKQVDFLLDLLFQGGKESVNPEARQKIVDFLAKDNPRGGTLDRRLRETAHAIILMPEYQLA